MSYGPSATQAAIYLVLSQDTQLQTLLEGSRKDKKIYDIVPQAEPFPFITMADIQWDNRGNHSWDGLSGVLTVHSWYRSPNMGRAGVQLIMKRIDEILHNSEPTITGWTVVSFLRGSSNIIVDEDRVTLHGIQTFKIMIGAK